MRNKRKFAFLPVVFATALMLGACHGILNPSVDPGEGWGPKPRSSEQGGSSSQGGTSSSQGGGNTSSSSKETPSYTPAKQKYIVQFVVNGLPVQISQVEEGQCAVYEGETPTRRGDKESKFYRFKKWDRDIKTPITADTQFNAVFTTYDDLVVVDDFENYADSPSMTDAGWVALGYKNEGGWTEDTKAAVSLGVKSVEGQKALRFDSWGNNVGYKFAKRFNGGEFPNAVNALRFRLMTPSFMTVKVLLHASVEIEGKLQAPSFTYTLKPTTSEYAEYTIPLDDDGWALWGEAGKSIKAVAGWTGIHQDDIVNYLTRIEFYLQGDDKTSGQPCASFCDSVSFVTLKEARAEVTTVNKAADVYTGKLLTGNIVRIEIGANGAATAKVVDLEDPVEVPGKVVANNDSLVFTSADNGATLKYVGNFTNGGQKVTFVSAEGQLAQAVGQMDLDAVQVVDNFESYDKDGTAYYVSNKDKNNRSGCRGAYYSEYYAGGTASSDWGGSGWSLLGGDGSQLKLKQDKAGAHSGNNYLCLKHSKSVAFRYMQWGLFDGTAEKQAFRGNKLSFWAKTNGLVKSFKVSMYSQSAPTNGTKDQQVRAQTFEQTAAIGQWKHFEIDLNPNLVYYGYMIFTEKNTSLSANEAWLYIDDVEVYGANPYAVFVPPEPDKLVEVGQMFMGKAMNLCPATIEIKKDNKCLFDFAQASMEDMAGTYSYSGNKITFDFGTLGKYVANLSTDGKTLTYVNSTDTISGILANVNMTMVDILDNAETYADSGKMYYQSNKDESNISGARGAYYCDYYSGGSGSPIGGSGWSLMGGSGDQLSLETGSANVHSGNNSLKLKWNKSNAMRYMTWGLYKGTAQAHTKANVFSFYVKNPTNYDMVLRTQVYTAQTITSANVGSARVSSDITVKANSGWVRATVTLDPSKTYYGVGFVPQTKSGAGSAEYFYVDDMMFLNEDNNIYSAITPYKGLTFNGKIAGGTVDASIRFDELGACYLSCAALGGEVKCSYNVFNNAVTINVPKLTSTASVIKLTIAPGSGSNTVTMTVNSCTGDLAAYVAANTVLTATFSV